MRPACKSLVRTEGRDVTIPLYVGYIIYKGVKTVTIKIQQAKSKRNAVLLCH